MAHDPADKTHAADAQSATVESAAAQALAEARAAEERAAAARARAAELRRLAEEASAATQLDQADEQTDQQAPEPPLWRRLVVPVSAGVAAAVVCALLALSGMMAWQRHAHDQDQQREAEYAAVARQGTINIMSLDFNDAQGSVQRVIDDSTGKFKEEFSSQSEMLVKALEQSKVVTEVKVDAVAVESMSADNAVVLVAAQSVARNAQDERKAPQRFRVAMTLTRDGGQPKISEVEFL
ncbi:hypothetical protein [Mycobacterium sp. ACS4331]|uniref:hypothetical protein n=1 Tax=Mycobacterium sp. ACS4331 TaxID=1834121 RepID=UPI0007FFD8B8|nr:hypothetical protein [Mycobacterium sp. ACS4331]OBF18549.1 hypothetical protein A5727_01125 [Mycobacterium sp. ACS4331]